MLWVATFAFLNLSWVMFRADSIAQALNFYKELFSFNLIELNRSFLSLMQTDGIHLMTEFIPVVGDYIKDYSWLWLFGLAFVLSVFFKNASYRIKNYRIKWYHPVITAGILFWCIMSFGGESSFLYWNF